MTSSRNWKAMAAALLATVTVIATLFPATPGAADDLDPLSFVNDGTTTLTSADETDATTDQDQDDAASDDTVDQEVDDDGTDADSVDGTDTDGEDAVDDETVDDEAVDEETVDEDTDADDDTIVDDRTDGDDPADDTPTGDKRLDPENKDTEKNNKNKAKDEDPEETLDLELMAVEAPGTVNNPALPAACGIKVMLVVDSSTSIVSPTNYSQQVKDAVMAFVTTLSGTGSSVGIVDFGINATLAVPYTVVTPAAVSGVFTSYVNGYTTTAGTNWDDALYKTSQAGAPDLVLFVTDGRPTFSNGTPADNHDHSQPGTGSGGNTTRPQDRSRAAEHADQLKTAGSHIFLVGVGSALASPDAGDMQSINAVTGDVRYPNSGQSFGNSDYALIADFNQLASALRDLVVELCSSSVSIQKVLDDGSGSLTAASGWEFTADVDLTSGDPHAYKWMAPDASATPGTPVSTTTGAGGIASWQWRPTNPQASATVKISETVESGYRFAGATCTTQTGATHNIDVDTASATVVVPAGPNLVITCEIVNEKQGTIIVEKRTAPAGSTEEFTFTGDAAGTISDGGEIVVSDLDPGTYTSTEIVPDGWTLADISCDDPNSSVDLSSGTATFVVDGPETIRCVFTNHQDGRIVLEKVADPATTGTQFTFTGDLAGTIGHGGTLAADVAPGTYTATEVVPDGWALTGLSADDANSTGDLENATATFNVDPGETVTFTFENTQLGTLRLVKQTIPAGTPGSFEFTGDVTGTIGDGGVLEVGGLLPGAYSATEQVPAGWTLTDISCDNSASLGGDLEDATAAYQLAAGETVTCTFTNTADADLTLTKTLTDGPTRNADGNYDVSYEIVVTNNGGPGNYDLDDAITFGDGITVVDATVANTTPGGIATNPDWDGIADTAVVTGQGIAIGAAHTYRVDVEASVAADITTEAGDCDLAQGEAGTGFLNTATVTVNGETVTDEDCAEVPDPDLGITKTLTDGPTVNADGNYDLTYEIVVTNGGEGPGTYDLDDTITFGDGIDVVAAAVANTTPGDITTNPDWDGIADTGVATGIGIAAGASHTYTVTVEASVAVDVTDAAGDCTLVQGETGTGFLNVATVTVDGETISDDDCAPVPDPAIEIGKTLTSGPTRNASGTYDLTYEIVVANTGDGPGSYDLADELTFGAGITVVAASVANTDPGTITTAAAWDGIDDTTVATGVNVAARSQHVYTVTVEASVVTTVTDDARDCVLGGGETGTGFLNVATITVDGEDISDDDCAEVPPAEMTITKTLISGPTLNASGTYDLTYEIVVTNVGDGPGSYDLDDEILFGDGITVVDAAVTNTDPGTLVANTAWNGLDVTLVVTGVPLAVGADHTFVVTVEAAVATSITGAAGDCELVETETGTGFLNSATVTVDDQTVSDEDCAEVPPAELGITKTLTSGPTLSASGTYDLTYEIVVANTGDGPGMYDLADELTFGDGIDVVTASVANTDPGSITTNASWDGIAELQVAGGVGLAAGAAHTYTVTVEAAVATTITTGAGDCVLDQGETGTGFLNVATVTVDGQQTSDEDCAEVPPAELGITKTLTAGPTFNASGNYDLSYEIVVTNAGDGPGMYDLADELTFGDGVTVVAASVANTQPGSIAVNATWDGIAELQLASGVGLAAGGEHAYQVTVEAAVATTITTEAGDCMLGQDETGTGFLNIATLTVDGEETTAEDCAPVPDPTFAVTKAVSSGPTLNAAGNYDISYQIVVSNTGDGPGSYDLADELTYGDGITVVTASVANTDPGSIVTNAAWDGIADLGVATGVGLGGHSEHTYQVTVEADVATTITTEAGDCQLTENETGTGFLNTVTMTAGDQELTDEDCGVVPGPGINITKTVVDGPTLNAAGNYDISYEIVVTNTEDGPGTYDLEDELLFGDGIEVVAAAVINTQPGDIAVNGDWDGIDDVVVAGGVGVAARTSHVYTVDVEASVATTITLTQGDCEVTENETGTGFLNTATITVDGEETSDEDCRPVPGTGLTLEKTLIGEPQLNDAGRYDITYEIVVSNVGEGPAIYDLLDELRFGDGIEVVAATVANTEPGDITVNGDWDGIADLVVTTGAGIVAGDVHLYTVVVEATVSPETTEDAADCRVETNENGTGFLNTATLIVDGEEVESSDCAPADVPDDPDNPTDNPDDPEDPDDPATKDPDGDTPLPWTGLPTMLLLGIGAALLLTGGTLVATTRRRRNTE